MLSRFWTDLALLKQLILQKIEDEESWDKITFSIEKGNIFTGVFILFAFFPHQLISYTVFPSCVQNQTCQHGSEVSSNTLYENILCAFYAFCTKIVSNRDFMIISSKHMQRLNWGNFKHWGWECWVWNSNYIEKPDTYILDEKKEPEE